MRLQIIRRREGLRWEKQRIDGRGQDTHHGNDFEIPF